LNAKPRKAGRDTQLRVRVVRWRTVANVDSIAFVSLFLDGLDNALLVEGDFLRGVPQGDFLRGVPQGDFLRGVPQGDFLRGV
jgi:hypothetical protein